MDPEELSAALSSGLGDADAVGPGDWVLIHVGFAISRIDEDEAGRRVVVVADDGQ